MSEEELREEIKNMLSWGHAHEYDRIIQEIRNAALLLGAEQGWDMAVDNTRYSDGTPVELESNNNPFRGKSA